MRRTRQFVFFASLVFLLLFLSNVVSAQTQEAVNVDLRIKTLFDLVNAYRAQNGLVLFKPSSKLTEVADWMARDMAAKNYFSHTDSLGRDPFARMSDLGYTYNTWKGENLAAGPDDAKTTLDLWKNSPGHNANILNANFTVMGLGRAYNVNTIYGWYWTQEFGGYLENEAFLNPVNNPPTGFYDGADCTHSWGWARDVDTTPPVRVKIFRDGADGAGGVFVAELTAGTNRSDLGMNLGFDWAIPNSLKDGVSHTMYTYGVDSDGGPNTLLSGSPKAITCAPSTQTSSPADLIITSLRFTPSSPQLAEKVTFDGVVKNTGAGNAASFFVNLRLDIDNNGTWDVNPGQILIVSLATSLAGGEKLFTVTWNEIWTTTVGTHKVEMCADAGSSIAESNEANNCLALTFSVASTATPSTPPSPEFVPSLPDTLSITEGALIRAQGDTDIWIVKYVGLKKFKRLILSPSVFNSYGHLRWDAVIEVDPAMLGTFITSDLVRAEGDTRVYRLFPSGDMGTKRWITTADAFIRNGFDWDAVYTINFIDRDSYIEGETYN